MRISTILRMFQCISVISALIIIVIYFTINYLTTVRNKLSVTPENDISLLNNTMWEEEENSSPEEPYFQWCPFQEKSTNFENGINCDELFEGKNKSVWKSAKNWTSPCVQDDHAVKKLTQNCTLFKQAFPFRWPKWEENSEEIVNFPLAFVLLVAKNSEQVVRLMQNIYRPWNLYCVTYDNHTEEDFKNSIKNLHTCYDNVILPETFVNVNWGGFSIINSVMNCMSVLDAHAIPWKYVQILSWNDFPLRTNPEMVEIMQIFNGSQDAELTRASIARVRYYYMDSDRDEKRKHMKKSLPPGNMTIYKGSMASTLSREFIHFVLRNKNAQHFYTWCNTTFAPEEHFFITLVHNLHIPVPGGFPGNCLYYYQLANTAKAYISRHQEWYGVNCDGMITKSSCVFGVGDLHRLIQRKELIAHKMYLDFEPAAYYCMAKRHFARTFDIRSKVNDNRSTFDREFYKNLPSVRYQNTKDKMYFKC